MNGRVLFAIALASLLGGFFFLMAESRAGGLVDGLSAVEKLFLGSVFIFLIGCVIGGTIVLLAGAWHAARRSRGGDHG